MRKMEIVKEWLKNNANIEWLNSELELWLENNHGADIQYSYGLINRNKEDLNDYYRKIEKKECLQLKWAIIKDVLEIVKNGIAYDYDIDISDSTIKKVMKETDFYMFFNSKFVNELNGESENIEIFKRWFIR